MRENTEENLDSNQERINWGEAFKEAVLESEVLKDEEEPGPAPDYSVVETLKMDNAALKDALLRKTAELENARRISKEEVAKALKYSISNFAKELLVVMDALSLAIKNAPKEELSANEKFDNFYQGVNITYKELNKIFEKNNVKKIDPLEEIFDPNMHQAVTQVENDKPEGTIVDVIQVGYLLNDRLLRPATVVVSKGK